MIKSPRKTYLSPCVLKLSADVAGECSIKPLLVNYRCKAIYIRCFYGSLAPNFFNRSDDFEETVWLLVFWRLQGVWKGNVNVKKIDITKFIVYQIWKAIALAEVWHFRLILQQPMAPSSRNHVTFYEYRVL